MNKEFIMNIDHNSIQEFLTGNQYCDQKSDGRGILDSCHQTRCHQKVSIIAYQMTNSFGILQKSQSEFQFGKPDYQPIFRPENLMTTEFVKNFDYNFRYKC